MPGNETHVHPGPDPDGQGTQGGGEPRRRAALHCPPAVTNQQSLTLDANVLGAIPEDELHKVALVQLQFARGVAELSVQAYDRIIAILQKTEEPAITFSNR